MSELRERVKHIGPQLDAGAGASLSKGAGRRGRSAENGRVKEILLLVAFVLHFIASTVSIHLGQLLGCWIYFFNKPWYYFYMSITKQQFGLLLTSITQWFSPLVIRISGDASVAGQFRLNKRGQLETSFPERLVMLSNHQIYTDWLYFWWIAYTGNMHGHIYIILKESLKRIPVLGPGMMFYGFIFLARNWAKDKARFHHRLRQLSTVLPGAAKLSPMWLLIFPEGTNFCPNGRKSSQKWAAKQNIADMQHLLLPRATGLQYCLQELQDTVEWVYDCTLIYEGIGRGEYGQDVYTLRSTYLRGQGPRSLNMYWRRFAVKDIPVNDPKAFDEWLRKRWSEKDEILENYFQKGRLPKDESAGSDQPDFLETEMKTRQPIEFLLIFLPLVPAGFLVYYLMATVHLFR